MTVMNPSINCVPFLFRDVFVARTHFVSLLSEILMGPCSKCLSVLYSSARLACPASGLSLVFLLLFLLLFPLHFSLSDLFIIDLLELCTPCAGCSTVALNGSLKPIIPSLRSSVLQTGAFYVQTLYLKPPVSIVR